MSNDIRINYSSGIATEPLRGYSRAVRIGPHLYVSGMTAMNEKGDIVGLNDHYQQTRYALENIRAVLKAADFQIGDVDGFVDEVEGSVVHRGADVLHVVVRGYHHGANQREALLDVFQQGQTVHDGHVNVAKNRRNISMIFQNLQRFLSVGSK